MDQEVVGLRIDARDQLCPAPLLMVKRALKGAKVGELIEVVVNDQTSRANILALCVEKRLETIRTWEDGGDFHLLFRNATI